MFSKTTEYALRATIYIAQKGSEENKIGMEEIAKAIDSPKSFTAKILQALGRDDRLIHSVSGPRGGFFLANKAERLPVRAVLDVMGEGDVLNKCVLGLNKCSENKPCPMHAQYKLIKQQLIDLFETKTIGELVEDVNNGDVFISNRKK